jgi:peptidoglycan hydrolase FlgJ
MIVPSVSGAASANADPRETAMKKAAADLEGLFVQQLYKSMRESVPADGGLVEKSQGEEVFAGLMDERMAADTGMRWHRGLGDAIYRALRQKAGLDAPTSASPNGTALPSAPLASPVRTS